MAELFTLPARATDSDNTPLPGAKLYFYTTGTTTPASVYTTSALSTPHSNPVVADSAGKFAAIYLDPTLVYRAVLKDADGVTTIYDIDPAGNGLGGPAGSESIGFKQAEAGAVTRTVQDKLRETVSVTDFGATPDNSTNNYTAIANALATGKPVHFPKTSAGNTYRFGTSLTFGAGAQVTMDDGVVLYYTGSTGAAVTLTGSVLKVQLGEVYSPLAPYAIRYYDLENSEISVRRPGSCTAACIYHDGDAQTANAGNNRWTVEDMQAGSVPYGLRIKNSASYILEGEIWDIKVIFSATTTAFRLGESTAAQKVRWNTYRLAIDAQGITPMLIDVYQDSNNIELINWAGQVSPPVAHVRFNTGTGNNVLVAGPGVQDPIQVIDNGSNFWIGQGQAGQRIQGGKLWVGLAAGGGTTTLQVGQSASAGDVIASIENTSSDNNTTKYAAFGVRGRDTIGTGKDVAQLRASPQDADWSNGTTILYGRKDDALVGYAFLGINGTPEGQITAPIGAIATRRDGTTSTTFYVKESGTGNTGWVAK